MNPMTTAPKNTFVLLCCPSGYTTTPYVFTSAIMHSDYKAGRWVDHANDDITDWLTEPPVGWLPMPAVRDSHAWCDICKAPPAAPCYHWCKTRSTEDALRNVVRGVRVQGDDVLLSVRGGNATARQLCGKLVQLIDKAGS